MFRPDRLLVRTYSCTAVPVPVPVPVAGIYYCTSNCAYACMRAVQNCMLARASAPEKFYGLCQYRRSKSVPNRLNQSVYVRRWMSVLADQIRKCTEPGTPARYIASDLLEFSCMCAHRAQSACHQSMGTGMCILNQFSEFWILKIDWKYIYIGWRALHESANSPVFRSVGANF